MRTMLIAAAAGLLLGACAPAGAQQGDAFTGTWAFQSEAYGNQEFGAVLSGAAIITPAAQNRYDIALITHELIVSHLEGQPQLMAARQRCTGANDGGQFTISCELAEPVENYAPDNFVLQQDAPGRLVGVLSSASSAQVTFTRLR